MVWSFEGRYFTIEWGRVVWGWDTWAVAETPLPLVLFCLPFRDLFREPFAMQGFSFAASMGLKFTFASFRGKHVTTISVFRSEVRIETFDSKHNGHRFAAVITVATCGLILHLVAGGRCLVGKSPNTVFFQWFVAPEGRKVGSLKRRVRSQLASWEMKSGEKHSFKSKCTKHQRRGPLLEVEMWKTTKLVRIHLRGFPWPNFWMGGQPGQSELSRIFRGAFAKLSRNFGSHPGNLTIMWLFESRYICSSIPCKSPLSFYPL